MDANLPAVDANETVRADQDIGCEAQRMEEFSLGTS